MTDREDESAPEEARSTEEPGAKTRGGEEEHHGDAASERRSAPPSAGIPHGSPGAVDPREAGPDLRPSMPERGEEARTEGPESEPETPVPSPVSRSGEGQGVGSGSAAAASQAAGSAPPAEMDEEPGDEEEEAD